MEVTADQQPITSDDVSLILNAQERLVAACMRGEGFEYPVQAPTDVVSQPPPYLSPDELRRGGYQYDWAAAAERFLQLNGPEGPPDPTAGMSEEEAAEYSNALSGSGEMVMLEDVEGGTTGFPADGCGAEAQIELYGSVANFVRFNRALETLSQSGVGQELQSMDSYQEALVEWQECMRRAGYAVGDTTDYGATWLQQQGANALAEQGSGQTVVTAELIESVATADADCQESSGLDGVREELLSEARDRIAARLGFEMAQYIAFQHAVLERAEQVN